MIGIIVFLIIAIIILSIVKSQLQGNEKVQKILNTIRIFAGVGILLSILLACVVQIGPEKWAYRFSSEKFRTEFCEAV
jgi:Na+-driven multidrug efflux pump